MKKVLVVAFVMLCTLLVSVKAQEANTHAQEFSMPCLADSYDSENAVGAWGVGKSVNQNEAYTIALKDAEESLARRFHISTHEIGSEANMWCTRMDKNENNEYVVYVSIKVYKSALLEIIKNSNL